MLLPKARITVNHLSRRAGRIVRQAKTIARECERGFVGTEHLLQAIVREDSGVAAHILRDHQVTEDQARAEIDKHVRLRMHDTCVLGTLPATPHLREVLSAAVQHARDMGGWQVCSVHLLLGLLGERHSTACKVLKTLGVTTDSVQKCLVREMAVG
jgi:ATP-dependent Clp protease ATP-binding subunit ClpC